MGSTNAERQRRYRRHKAGDHSLCGPRCLGGTPAAVTRDVTPAVTQRLGERGRRIWREEVGDKLTGARRALLEEACRLADRLDQLDRQLRGDEDAWMRLRALNDDGSIVTVVVNGLLAEARQQQVALKQILGELRQSHGSSESKPARPPGPSSEVPGGERVPAGVTSIAARIAAKRGGTATG